MVVDLTKKLNFADKKFVARNKQHLVAMPDDVAYRNERLVGQVDQWNDRNVNSAA